MNIDRAILVKESYHRNPLSNFNKEEKEADQLSIEALKRVEALRDPPHYKIGFLLPSETEE